MKKNTVMIVDSNEERAAALQSALLKNENIQAVSLATSRESAIKQLEGRHEVVLLNPDVLKQRTLSRFIRSVFAKASSARVMLLLDQALEDNELVTAIKAGIRGYVRTEDVPAIVARAISAVARGEVWAERRILAKAISRPMLLPETLHSHVPGLSPLTGREMEMLTMVLQGATNREIAENSSISERTVKTHLYRIYKKLNVKSRTKAIALLSQS